MTRNERSALICNLPGNADVLVRIFLYRAPSDVWRTRTSAFPAVKFVLESKRTLLVCHE
jgi:hypothetical protein